jgi:CheY-like chemotaxis protein
LTLGTTQPRVLVVDDDPAIRTLCSINLRRAGLEVLEAEDGMHGLERALADRPDFVVLDVMLPGLDGLELATRLHGDERTSRIPLVFLTGERDRKKRKRARALGALAYVTKPFDPVALADLVAGALAGGGNAPLVPT